MGVPKDLDIIFIIILAAAIGLYMGAVAVPAHQPDITTIKNFLPPGSEDYVAKVRKGPMKETIIIHLTCSGTAPETCRYVITNYFNHTVQIYSVTDITGKVLASNITLEPGASTSVPAPVRSTDSGPEGAWVIIVRTSEGVWYGI